MTIFVNTSFIVHVVLMYPPPLKLVVMI